MALSQIITIGSPRNGRGQGTVEAILALPVFLLFICILFQLFLIAIAQVHLRYAAFCAARVGAVRNADLKEMNDAAGKVLSGATRFLPTVAGFYSVEKLNLLGEKNQTIDQAPVKPGSLLKIRVHWDYPLLIPFVDTLLSRIIKFQPPHKKSTIPLQATWITVKYEVKTEKNDGK